MSELTICSSTCPYNQNDEALSLSDEELMESWFLHGCRRCFEKWVERVWNNSQYKGIVQLIQKDWQQIDVPNLRSLVIEKLWLKPRHIVFVKSYFRTMLWRAAFDENEKRKRHQATHANENDEILANIQEVPLVVDDSRSDELEICMQKLKPNDLKLTKARYFGELNLNDIAKELNKSMDTIYQQLARIRKLLKQCMEG